MRIERNGPPIPLVPRVERFILEGLKGRSLDEAQSPSELRADYVCLNGLLVIEQKVLEEPPDARLSNFIADQQRTGDWPPFLGSAPLDSFIRNTKDPDATARGITERMNRAIVNHLKKANRQLEAHGINFSRKNMVRIVLMINDDHEAYTPETVAYATNQFLLRQADADPTYQNIDAVIYLSERHFTAANGYLAMPIIIIEGSGVEFAPWKQQVLHHFSERWARWNEQPAIHMETDFKAFDAFVQVPEQMTRNEKWKLDYERNPYMRNLTNETIRDKFDEHMVRSVFLGRDDLPYSISVDELVRSLPEFAGLITEMGRRAIPITDFPVLKHRLIEAAWRLGLPAAAVDWLQRNHPG